MTRYLRFQEVLLIGFFEYVNGFKKREATSEVFEADFFRFIKARDLLDELAESCPTPGRKSMCLSNFMWPAIFPYFSLK
jgi:hypothetical protein